MRIPRTHEVRCRCSDADHERLQALCKALEMTQAEVLRYYIRAAYEALGRRQDTPPSGQLAMWAPVLPDGKTPIPSPIPAPIVTDPPA